MAITLTQSDIDALHDGSIRNRKLIQAAVKQAKRRINDCFRFNHVFWES